MGLLFISLRLYIFRGILKLINLTVILPIYNSFDCVEACLHSLFHESLDPCITNLILVDDSSTDPRIQPLLLSYSSECSRVVVVRNQINIGYLASVNSQLLKNDGAVILLNSDTIVPSEWATTLHNGAEKYSRLATLTPLSNNATFSQIPDPSQWNVEFKDSKFSHIQSIVKSEFSQCFYPLAPSGMGFCMYITPLALALVGQFDPKFSPGYEEENDFCMRARSYGLQCRIATNLIVLHKGGSSFDSKIKKKLQHDNYKLINRKHPVYHSLITDWFQRADLPALLLPESSGQQLSILFDAQILEQSLTGVVRYVLTLLEGLLSDPRVKELFIVSENKTLRSLFLSSLNGVNWITDSELALQAWQAVPRFHIYHVANANISLDRFISNSVHAIRTVFTLHDLIAFENPSYSVSGDEFLSYRYKLSTLVALSDVVLSISNSTKNDALEQLPMDPERCCLFPNPLNHINVNLNSNRLRLLNILVVGTDFYHKNLMQTLIIFENVLLTLPNASLTFAGPAVSEGGTIVLLKNYVNNSTLLRDKVIFLGPVTDVELKNLYETSTLCLYLSIQEGFGYVPFEAAACNCPCLVSNTSVFSAFDPIVVIKPYLNAEAIDAICSLLTNRLARDKNISIWIKALEDSHSRPSMDLLIQFYDQALFMSRNRFRNLLLDNHRFSSSTGSPQTLSSMSLYRAYLYLLVKTYVKILARIKHFFKIALTDS